MSYSSKSELLALLQQHGLRAQKSLSQNFLVDYNILKKIVDAEEVTKKDDVVEVGPGLGVLTQELLKRAGHVRAIELDPQIVTFLEEHFSQFPNFTLEKGNALKAKLPTTPYKVIANLPYAISSPLLSHFLQPKTPQEKRPECLVVMVQKEVADKICCKEPQQSILSLQVQIFGKPAKVCKVSKGAFYPPPKVDSAVIRIDVFDKPLVENTELFFKLIKKAFTGKRKTLLNALEGIEIAPEKRLDKTNVMITLTKSKISLQARAQELSISQWKSIINALTS